ncbi:MAG: hypothetical protein GW910_00175 [Candidatus Altiarchaeum hamiconexum]|uniref:CARDB domain-containing protein n=2 Tax=Candidatus Altarchaeum hamiconexum TaxID=1803513 RepID=A0A8J8CE78_9ARCH|nr:hypothetical protein [Candidatus Altarchaeum hamiconexum]OIQ05668.1 MAG: hypothetical protein AUK59_02995 [Candidatus Altarchaeum sp. CG2_30_32_3053]
MINLRVTLLGIIVFYILINLAYALPDLVAEIDYYPKNASVGDNITVIATVKNTGEVDTSDVQAGVIKVGMINAPFSKVNISANSEKNWTFDWTMRYGKVIMILRVDYSNLINETNETNNIATLTFDFPIFIKTDKKEYKVEEPINISIIGNNGSGYTFVRHLFSFPFNVFKFENGSWKEILIKHCRNNPPVCHNNKITHILGECLNYWPTCRNVPVNSSWIWNPKHHWIHEKNLTCGNQTYDRWTLVPIEPGQYKLILYYGGYNGDCRNIYTESNNFTILQNCYSDSDCAYGEKCINETCLPVQNYCENNSQCADDQICLNHTCQNISCEYWQIAINHSCVLRYGYCENVDNCNFDQICLNHTCQNISCEYWQIAINHSCVTASGYCKDNSECSSGYYCSSHTCHMSSNSGGGTREINYAQPTDTNATTTILKEFSNEVPEEIKGLIITFNLGKNASGADVIAIVGNKTSKKAIANINGTVTINLPEYGQGKIIISKAGYKNLTKTIKVYAGKLNITKISGENYGEKFKFRVTDEKGNAVKDTEVEVYGEKLKTNAQGIVEKEINVIQTKLVASATKENYKNSSLVFDVKVSGTLKITAPNRVNEGDKVIVKVTDENNKPVANARVDVAGKEYTTDEKGEVEITAMQTMALKASKEGYISSEQTSVSVEAKIECGNKICEAGETKENCPQDCIVCGDGYCDNGEDYKTCPGDCPKPEEFLWLLIIVIMIMLLISVYFLIFRKNKKQ